MANGQILRGEVYWVCVDDSIGSEQQTGRPALILSGNRYNVTSDTVIVAYMTNGGLGNYHSVCVNYAGKPERVLCNQVRTIDKQRLTRYVGTLSEPEMRRVSGGLAICMCIPTGKDLIEIEPEEKDDSEMLAMKAETEMWKRLYEKTMDQLVEFKVNVDLEKRLAQRAPVVVVAEEQPKVVVEEPQVEEPKVEVEPVVEEPVVVKFEPEPEKVDLNSCDVEDLKKCGCTEVIARTIIGARPYTFVEDLRRIPGITNVGFGILKNKVCVKPMVEAAVEELPVVIEEAPVVAEPEQVVVSEPVVEGTPVVEQTVESVESAEKININTVTAKELMETLGLGAFYAYTITGYRRKNGRYVDLKELLEVPKLPKWIYEKFADRLTIGGEEEPVVEEPKPAVVGGKVNVNTASAKELSEALGLSLNVCYAITGKRNREGLFTSLEQIIVPKRFTEGMLEMHRDKLTLGESQPEPEEEPAEKKLNINTASLRELMDVGFEKRAAALIVNERKKYGQFRSLDDLAEIPEITGKILRKLRDKLEV